MHYTEKCVENYTHCRSTLCSSKKVHQIGLWSKIKNFKQISGNLNFASTGTKCTFAFAGKVHLKCTERPGKSCAIFSKKLSKFSKLTWSWESEAMSQIILFLPSMDYNSKTTSISN